MNFEANYRMFLKQKDRQGGQMQECYLYSGLQTHSTIFFSSKNDDLVNFEDFSKFLISKMKVKFSICVKVRL